MPNGYINIKLGGVNRGIKFGNRALLNIIAKHDFNGDIKPSFELVTDLVYFGLANNCLMTKTEIDFTEDDVMIWVDDLPLNDFTDIYNAFVASYTGEVETKKPAKSTTAKK